MEASLVKLETIPSINKVCLKIHINAMYVRWPNSNIRDLRFLWQ